MNARDRAMTRLFHYGDQSGLGLFTPRPPLRRPDAEPLVYAIDERHAPLYLFPRDCPRIGVWPLAEGPEAMRLLIDRRSEAAWREGRLVRYELDPRDGFVDCHDHGVWVSRGAVRPVGEAILTDLPAELAARVRAVEVVDSLADASRAFYDPVARRFIDGHHVSMIRMALLPDWNDDPGTPVLPT